MFRFADFSFSDAIMLPIGEKCKYVNCNDCKYLFTQMCIMYFIGFFFHFWLVYRCKLSLWEIKHFCIDG